jgi:cytoskeletal protein CcmA (bactofilin family)
MFKKETASTVETISKNTGVESIIAKDVIVRGDVLVKGTIRVDGMVEGNLEVTGQILIGKTGFVKGIIRTDNLIVAGRIEGNTEAAGKVTLNPSGKLWGDILCQSLLIEDGAMFQGSCAMHQAKEEKPLSAELAAFNANRSHAAEESAATTAS